MRIRSIAIVAGLILASGLFLAGYWFWPGGFLVSSTEISYDANRDVVLPRPDHAVRYQLESSLSRGSGADRVTITHRYQIDYRPPDQFLLKVIGELPSSTEQTIQSDSIQLRTDGDRFRVDRAGEIFLAGELESNSMKFLSRMPGGSTYLMAALTGRNPFDTKPAVEKEAGRTRFREENRRVYFSGDGRMESARGPTRWIEQRESPYGPVDYSETVTDIDNVPGFPPDHFEVSKNTVRVAQGDTGTSFPNHRFQTMEDQTVRLFDIEGPYLINRWATWCPPCVFEIPHLNEIQKEYEGQLTVIGITGEDTGVVREFLRRDQAIDYQILRQPGPPPVPYRNMRTLPFTFLVDSGGTLRKVVRGARTRDQWAQLIEDHLMESPTH